VLADVSITPSTTVDRIVEALSEAILRGELAPGSRVRESALATQLGVSRNTVREAVLVLQQTGLVRHVVNRGAIVRPVDVGEVADLYRVREILELSGVGSVAGGADLSSVRSALDELEAAAFSGDVTSTVEQDLAFHGSIVGLLGSPRLDEYFVTLRQELRYYLAVISHAHKETEQPKALVEQHAIVYRALERGNADRAGTLLRDHIQLNARMVLELLDASREP
jgi:DNA-binding GntR family transcriptional regulator